MKLENQILQNLMKRDPESYTEEFLTQWRSFEAALLILKTSPGGEQEDFEIVVNFLSHIIPCYSKSPVMTDEIRSFPKILMDLLDEHAIQMQPQVRKSIVTALILLRNRGQIPANDFLQFLFSLFKLKDKQLRDQVYSHIISDVKNENSKSKNNQLNKSLQRFMYTMLSDSNETAAKYSLMVMVDLYKKNVWNDSKTVNVIADACFSSNYKLMATALHFFLGADEKIEEDEDSDGADINSLKHVIQINKKKKSRKVQIQKVLGNIKKKNKKQHEADQGNFSALQLINDPQGFTEKLFSRLKQAKSTGIKFEARILLLNVISRMIHVHQLIVIPLYDFVLPLIKPSQQQVTAILAYTAQACHPLVPPDVVEPVVNTIANNFVWSNCANEVVVAGLNSLREICARCPLAMPQELIRSLVDDYRSHKEKGMFSPQVMITITLLIT